MDKPTNPGSSDVNWKAVGIGCGVFLCLLLVISLFAAGLGWQEFVKYGIASDITEYIEILQQSDCEPSMQADLIQQLEQIRVQVRHGQHVNILLWLDYDTSIRNMIEDQVITPAEYESLKNELDNLGNAR
ncbi:MAG: hypothetical protein JXA13_06720 [Anaerolineales bacterium]|nr:hypothetical protein [Anaerolineales bacterium]